MERIHGIYGAEVVDQRAVVFANDDCSVNRLRHHYTPHSDFGMQSSAASF